MYQENSSETAIQATAALGDPALPVLVLGDGERGPRLRSDTEPARAPVDGALGADEAESEARSTLAFSLMIGQHLMAADHGARSHEEALELAARWLLA